MHKPAPKKTPEAKPTEEKPAEEKQEAPMDVDEKAEKMDTEE